jgi:hypothetical protein
LLNYCSKQKRLRRSAPSQGSQFTCLGDAARCSSSASPAFRAATRSSSSAPAAASGPGSTAGPVTAGARVRRTSAGRAWPRSAAALPVGVRAHRWGPPGWRSGLRCQGQLRHPKQPRRADPDKLRTQNLQEKSPELTRITAQSLHKAHRVCMQICKPYTLRATDLARHGQQTLHITGNKPYTLRATNLTHYGQQRLHIADKDL